MRSWPSGTSRNRLNHILWDHDCQYKILQQSIKLLLGNLEWAKVEDWLIEQEVDHMASIAKKASNDKIIPGIYLFNLQVKISYCT